METATALPDLEAHDIIEADVAAAIVSRLGSEIARLEGELAGVEAAVATADDGVSIDLRDGSLDAARRAADETVTAGRAEIRRTIEEPGLRVAADRLLAARREAQDILRAARAEVGAALLATPSSDEAAVEREQPSTDVPEAAAEPEPSPEPVGARAPEAAGIVEDAAFDAFWHEENEAGEVRTRALLPLEVLLPMAVMLLLLVLVLLFI